MEKYIENEKKRTNKMKRYVAVKREKVEGESLQPSKRIKESERGEGKEERGDNERGDHSIKRENWIQQVIRTEN